MRFFFPRSREMWRQAVRIICPRYVLGGFVLFPQTGGRVHADTGSEQEGCRRLCASARLATLLQFLFFFTNNEAPYVGCIEWRTDIEESEMASIDALDCARRAL